MRIEYQNYFLEMDGEIGAHELYFRLFYIEPEAKIEYEVFNCSLMGLWKDENERETQELLDCWAMHVEGDYFQQTTLSLNKEILLHTSFNAVFHEIIRNTRDTFYFINNIYSTSDLEWLSFGYTLYGYGRRFWVKQLENGLAEWIENEKRYKAILE